MSIDFSYDTTDYSYNGGYADYGYQDFSTASNEAYQMSWDAYNAGDMNASNYWSTVSWDNWGTSTDLYANGADAYGTESPSTSAGYYGDVSYDTTGSYDTTSTYDTTSSYDTTSTYDSYATTSSYDSTYSSTSSYDYSSSSYDTSSDYSS